MRLNVLGLVSVDTLAFEEYTSYLGGGALATAWIASLWEIPTTLYSVSCKNIYNEVLDRNLSWNAEFFSHIILSKDKPMTAFKISKHSGDYKYEISNLNDSHNQLVQFLTVAVGEQYIKLPATNFINVGKLITVASINPQGAFDLIDFVGKVHTNGFIFLNNKELLAATKRDFLLSLKIVESTQQSFVITLGKHGAICYCADNSKWCFCPSIQSTNCISSLGCGDAFAGGFLAAKVKQYSITDCMFYGTISAYLATYSPCNMVTAWLNTTCEASKFENIKKGIRYFSTADDLMTFLQSTHDNSVILKMSPYISYKFNWELSNYHLGERL